MTQHNSLDYLNGKQTVKVVIARQYTKDAIRSLKRAAKLQSPRENLKEGIIRAEKALEYYAECDAIQEARTV